MYVPNLPEAWEIAELEKLRRAPEWQEGERATIPLFPPTAPPSERSERKSGGTVIVIEL